MPCIGGGGGVGLRGNTPINVTDLAKVGVLVDAEFDSLTRVAGSCQSRLHFFTFYLVREVLQEHLVRKKHIGTVT
jgi:hypothetical protein